MRRKLLLLSVVPFVLLYFSLIVSVEAASMWSRAYGGPGYDAVYALVATSDGGYAIAGRTYPYGAGNSDFWLVKVDALGVIPEFPSNIGLAVSMITVTLTAVLMKKRSE